MDKNTGKTIWKVERPTDAPANRPITMEPRSSSRSPVNCSSWFRAATTSRATISDTGKELWRIGGFNPTNNAFNRTIASSLVIGGNVFTTSTRGRPFIAFRAGGSGNITGKSELWTNNLGADVPTPTTDGKYIYVLVDNGIMHCVEAATGTVAFQGQRIELGTYSSSPLLADGKILLHQRRRDDDGGEGRPGFRDPRRQQARQPNARQPGGG